MFDALLVEKVIRTVFWTASLVYTRVTVDSPRVSVELSQQQRLCAETGNADANQKES